MALPYPTSTDDVAALENRIRKRGIRVKVGTPVKFGASSHMAKLILACNHQDPNVRAAVNLHYNKELVEMFQKAGFTVSCFNRNTEPERVKIIEGETLKWGIREAIRKTRRMPDVIYDIGEVGKEPMIRILGRSAAEAVDKIHTTLKLLKTEFYE